MAPFRILLVEDSVLFAMALEDALRDHGHAVASAASLAAARRHLAEDPVQLAFIDLRLPDGEALELARQLRDAGCAVALVTGLDLADSSADLDGMHVFPKPASIDRLLDWVDTLQA